MNKIKLIEKAQRKLEECINLIEEAISDTSDKNHIEAYLVDHLKIFLGNDHGFCSDNLNLDKVMQMLQDEDEDEYEDEDEDEDNWK